MMHVMTSVITLYVALITENVDSVQRTVEKRCLEMQSVIQLVKTLNVGLI